MRKRETIDRQAWEAMLDNLDADTASRLRTELDSWEGGDTCQSIEVSLDSLGRLDSLSAPMPA
jgi:hypothetical protein